MTNEELKLRCLELAIAEIPGESSERQIEEAKLYFDFIYYYTAEEPEELEEEPEELEEEPEELETEEEENDNGSYIK